MTELLTDWAATSPGELDEVVSAASGAFAGWADAPAGERARVLVDISVAVDDHRDELVALAKEETSLPDARLQSELTRTTFQLRLFAQLLREGSYADARIDHADPEWPAGAPRPDIRRVLEPLGPVLVFSASNFPFAFSVLGGDTAAALAAGCPVVVKAHSGHPRLSAAVGAIAADAIARAGAPAGLLRVVFGQQAGVDALRDPRIAAASFTGSTGAGRKLFDIANARPTPIPFYGELGSVNPVVVTRGASAARSSDIASGLLTSFTFSAGQLCTKPGVVFLPEGSPVIDELAAAELPPAVALLNERIEEGYAHENDLLRGHVGVGVVKAGEGPLAPAVLRTTTQALTADPDTLFVECFGPTVLLVTYADEPALFDALRVIDGQLTATIHGEPDEQVARDLVAALRPKAGRLLWNQWPTGVSVTFAQNHGGPYPATTSVAHTAVGTASIDRFLRPVAYQGFPTELLPAALQDDNPLGLIRRVDGVLTDPHPRGETSA